MALKSFVTGKAWEEPYSAVDGRAISKIFIAELHEADFNLAPSEIRAMAVTAGLPVPFSTIYDGLLCKSVNASRVENAQNLVKYTAMFDSRGLTPQQQQRLDDPNPVNWKPETKFFIQNVEIPTDEDRNGKVIVNTAGVRLLERLLVPDVETAFEISATYTTLPSWWTSDSLIRTMNSTATKVIWIPSRRGQTEIAATYAAGKLRFIPGQPENDHYNGIDFVRINFRLEVCRSRKFRQTDPTAHTRDSSPNTYDNWNAHLAYLNCGFMQLDDDDELVKITLQNGEEPREELLLNHLGHYDPGDQLPTSALYVIPDIHAPASYTSLPNCGAG